MVTAPCLNCYDDCVPCQLLVMKWTPLVSSEGLIYERNFGEGMVENCFGSSDKEQEIDKYFSRVLSTVYRTMHVVGLCLFPVLLDRCLRSDCC